MMEKKEWDRKRRKRVCPVCGGDLALRTITEDFVLICRCEKCGKTISGHEGRLSER